MKHSLSSSSLLSSVRRKPRCGVPALYGRGAAFMSGGPCLKVTSSKDRGEGAGTSSTQISQLEEDSLSTTDEMRGF